MCLGKPTLKQCVQAILWWLLDDALCHCQVLLQGWQQRDHHLAHKLLQAHPLQAGRA